MNYRKQLLISFGFTSGITIILLVALFFLISDTSARADKITQTRLEINNRTKSGAALAELHREFDMAQSYIPRIENFLPPHDQLFSFSKDISLLGQKNKVSLVSTLGSDERSSGQSFGKTNFNLTADGAFDNLVNTLRDIKNSRYPISVQNLEIGAQGKSSFRLTVTGQVFSF